jgi:ABC-type nickel/cobalt efflux system permease component RcnA
MFPELSSELSFISILALGFALGLKHAVEADHLAAVTTIVSERRSLWSASLVGGFWGVGHTISLFIVGALVVFLKLQIDEKTEGYLESGVGVMLVLLGANALYKLLRGDKPHLHKHTHDGKPHIHLHTHEKAAKNTHHKLTIRSVVVGMIHGLAGSAALMLLIVPTIASPLTAMLFILVFGVGSIGGMMLMSLLVGLPLHFTASRFLQINFVLRCLAGVVSCILGALIIHEKLFA